MDMEENLEFKENTTKKKTIVIIAAIVLFLVAIGIAIVIGHFAIKKPESKDDSSTKTGIGKAEFQKRQEAISNHHESFKEAISEGKLKSSLK